MKKVDIEKSLKKILFKLFGHEDLGRVQYFSLKEFLELFMAVEDDFKIVIPLKSIKQLLTLDALVEFIHQKMSAKNLTIYPF